MSIYSLRDFVPAQKGDIIVYKSLDSKSAPFRAGLVTGIDSKNVVTHARIDNKTTRLNYNGYVRHIWWQSDFRAPVDLILTCFSRWPYFMYTYPEVVNFFIPFSAKHHKKAPLPVPDSDSDSDSDF